MFFLRIFFRQTSSEVIGRSEKDPIFMGAGGAAFLVRMSLQRNFPLRPCLSLSYPMLEKPVLKLKF
jgi:hypothetical protein